MDTFNVIVGVIGVIAFLLAIYQYLEARKMRNLEVERLRVQEMRNASSRRAVFDSVQAVNLIVQRAKDPASTASELQAIGRVARSMLLSLAFELKDESDLLRTWRMSRSLLNSSEEPSNIESPGDGEAETTQSSSDEPQRP